MKGDTKGLIAMATLLAVGVIWVTTSTKQNDAAPTLPASAFSIQPAPPVLSAPPEGAIGRADAGADAVPSAAPPDAIARPAKRFSPDDRVRASIGRWRSDAGLTLEVDPPKDLDDDHPPYRLVLRGPGLPRSGYGCEFSAIEKTAPVEGATFFSAWCAKKEKGSFVVLSQDDLGRLSVAVLSDHKVRVRADQLTRVETDRKPPETKP